MEHRLLLGGGEHLLPFARSCITKLKKLGLPYANQSFEIDGVSVKVRIEPGHEYIRIEGGSCLFDMDSGVVVLPPGEIYSPGKLYWGGSAATYNSVFQPPKNGRIEHTGAGSFSGRVNVAPVLKLTKGSLLPNNSQAASFSPGDITTDSTPPEVIPDPADEVLKEKRQSSGGSAIYTGKCRLYVQSILGTPLYKRDKAGKVTGSNDYIRGGRLAPYVKPGTTPDPYPADIYIDTGFGVYMDPETGKHWLFAPGHDNVAVFPLISSPCGEANRKQLIAGKSKLDQTDRDHLEAYILAVSRPDVSKRQICMTRVLPAGITMGYRWHWAWSTPVADMVVNDGFNKPGFGPAMRSTHYRIVMSQAAPATSMKDGKEVITPGVWSATLSEVDGPSDWAVNREMWPIMEPSGGFMHKITGTTFDPFECNAPFYVFYLRDEIQVCRISVEKFSAVTSRYTTDYFSSEVPGTPHGVPGLSMGLNDADSRDDIFSQYWVATVTCGSWSSPPGYMGWHKATTGLKISGKRQAPAPTGYPDSLSSDFAAPGNFTYLPSGSPSGGPYTPVWGTTPTDHPYRDTGGIVGFTKTEYSLNQYRNTTFVVAVPHGDAEALYFRHDLKEVTDNMDVVAVYSGGSGPNWASTWEIWSVGSTWWTKDGHLENTIPHYTWEGGFGFGHTQAITSVPKYGEKHTGSTVLLGRGGANSSNLPEYNYHVGSEEYVNVTISATSGSGVSAPIVNVPDLMIGGELVKGAPRLGMPPGDTPLTAIVGWV